MKIIFIRHMVEHSNIPSRLIYGVVKQSGGYEIFKKNAKEMSRRIDAGFSGWIQSAELMTFTKTYKREILIMAENDVKAFGEKSLIDMIMSLNCMKDVGTESEIKKVIFSQKGGSDKAKIAIYKCLAWYAAENVSRLYCDLCRRDI